MNVAHKLSVDDRLNPRLVTSCPRASMFKSLSVILITSSRPNIPNLTVGYSGVYGVPLLALPPPRSQTYQSTSLTLSGPAFGIDALDCCVDDVMLVLLLI